MKYKYLPTAYDNCTDDAEEFCRPEPEGKYPCPCCGCITLPVPQNEAIAYICPVCFWENDVFISSDDEPSDENGGITLNTARENYKKFSAARERLAQYTRPPRRQEMPIPDKTQKTE